MRRVMILLWQQSPLLLVVSTVASVLCALFQVDLLHLVSQYVGNPKVPPARWYVFGLLVLGVIVTNVTSTLGIGYIANNTVRQLRTGIARAILRASLATTEQIGSSRLLNNIQEDAGQIVNALPGFTGLIRDILFAVGCLAYLGYLSPTIFIIMSCIIGVGVLAHTPLQKRGGAAIQLGAIKAERRFSLLRNLIEGAKQLKSNAALRNDVIEELQLHDLAVARYNRQAFMYFTSANSVAVALLFTLVAIMIYSRVSIFDNPYVIASYTLAIFFLLNPLQGILAMAQSVTRAGFALTRFEDLRRTLELATESPVAPGEQHPTARPPFRRSLQLAGITHAYSTADRQNFTLGPIDLTLVPGEVLFIVGGNGSGKTTLAKIIMGLYEPKAGEISLDGVRIDSANRDCYRHLFSGVPNDFCLFDGLANTSRERFAGNSQDLLARLMLDQVVEPGHGVFAQAQSFSSGERRRVALFLAWLDDAPIYVFDEFAADQDPEAKELFYYGVLGELRRKQKLVIVVTHDNRYFDEADVMLTLERNQPPVVTRNRVRRAVEVLSD